MRRAGIMLAVLTAAVVAIVALRAPADEGSYRVSAIFDTADGLVAGQQVKVAGAVVGSISRVSLAPGPKAKVDMEVDRRFGPFRSDAHCEIRPEGLISENYIECDPGSDARALPARAGTTPTVPVAQTAAPTSFQDVLNVFSLPTDQRLRILFSELGIATAGRGDDINAILRRSNPALAQTHRALSILAGQRRRLAAATRQTGEVLAELAQRSDDVREFVDRTATVAGTTATHREGLRGAIHRLPDFLQATRTGLRSIDRTIANAPPLLADLRAAAPHLDTFTRIVPRFSTAGTAALRDLTPALRTGRTAVRAAVPFARHLRDASAEAVPFSRNLATLLASTRDQGGFEGLARVIYGIATSMSAYDNVSHFVGFMTTMLPDCIRDANAPGCNHHYYAPGNGTVAYNSPNCRPASVAPWAPPTDCSTTPVEPPSESATRSSRPRAGAAADHLLDYLLAP